MLQLHLITLKLLSGTGTWLCSFVTKVEQRIDTSEYRLLSIFEQKVLSGACDTKQMMMK